MSLIEFQSNWLANPRLVDMFVVPIPCSSMVERAAVNRQVTGSSPVGGVQTVGLSRGRPSCLQADGPIVPAAQDPSLRDAFERANTLAKGSGSRVGALQSASQGVIKILARGEIDNNEYGRD